MRRSITAICIATLVAVLGVVAAGAPAALAGPRADTQVTARFNEDFQLVGEAKSVRACEKGRKILLIKDSRTTGRETVDRTRTDRAGNYSLGAVMFEDGPDYLVKATAAKRGRFACKADSTPIRVR